MRSRLVIAPIAVAALVPALLGMAAADTTQAPTPPRPAATSQQELSITLQVIDTPDQGRVYTDLNGQVLYHFDGDNGASGTFGCRDMCLALYPPMLVQPGTEVELPPGLAGTAGTVVRPDGVGTQVTLNGSPLYTYSGDLPGDTNGIAPDWHAAQAISAPPPPAAKPATR